MTLNNSKIFFVPMNAWNAKYLILLEIANERLVDWPAKSGT